MKFITGESTDTETCSKNISTGSVGNSQEKCKYVLVNLTRHTSGPRSSFKEWFKNSILL